MNGGSLEDELALAADGVLVLGADAVVIGRLAGEVGALGIERAIVEVGNVEGDRLDHDDVGAGQSGDGAEQDELESHCMGCLRREMIVVCVCVELCRKSFQTSLQEI